jgi:hypothetical protein
MQENNVRATFVASPLLKVAPAKPGYKTTEFYVAVATQVVSVLVLLGVLGPEAKDTVTGFVGDFIVHSTALVAMAVSAWKYIHARTQAKSDAPQFLE